MRIGPASVRIGPAGVRDGCRMHGPVMGMKRLECSTRRRGNWARQLYISGVVLPRDHRAFGHPGYTYACRPECSWAVSVLEYWPATRLWGDAHQQQCCDYCRIPAASNEMTPPVCSSIRFGHRERASRLAFASGLVSAPAISVQPPHSAATRVPGPPTTSVQLSAC